MAKRRKSRQVRSRNKRSPDKVFFERGKEIEIKTGGAWFFLKTIVIGYLETFPFTSFWNFQRGFAFVRLAEKRITD